MLPVIGIIAELAREAFTEWQASRADRRKVRAAAAEYRAEQARSADTYRQEWELRALEGRDQWLRRISFVIVLWPLVWVQFSQTQAIAYFQALESLPVWYRNLIFGVLGVVWGLAEFKQYRAGAGKV